MSGSSPTGAPGAIGWIERGCRVVGGLDARVFQRRVQVGMIGVNVPIPVPMAFYSFGGWKDSLFGDHHIQDPEGIRFYTRRKAVTVRRPEEAQDAQHHASHMHFPTAV
jgi:malonate-semialdehyde dehydrogenase (acetylating)/methylmalonate-semialdehyde dehydrogenase